MNEYSRFLGWEVPAMLKKLKPDATPQWGQMTADQMLEHLRRAVEMTLEGTFGKSTLSAEKLAASQKFLMSDQPLPQGRQAPPSYFNYEIPQVDFDQRKLELMKMLVAMGALFEKDHSFTADHPNFGRLNVLEWSQLHRKHIQHHFRQFGLL